MESETSAESDSNLSSESENSAESEYDPEEEARSSHRKTNHAARARKHADTRKIPQKQNAARDRKRAATRKKKMCSNSSASQDPRLSNVKPTEEELGHFEQEPNSAQMVFRLMAGVPEDTRRAPKPNMPSTDHASILSEYVTATGHDVSIKVCAPCGKRAPMNEEEYRTLPFTHNTLSKNYPQKTR